MVLASLHTVIRVEIQLPQHLTRIDILPKLLPVNSISSLMPATTWVVTIDLDLDKHVICPPWHFCSSPRVVGNHRPTACQATVLFLVEGIVEQGLELIFSSCKSAARPGSGSRLR